MRGSVTATFSEPEEFEAAMSGNGDFRLTVTKGRRFRAQTTELSLRHLRLVSVEESLPRIAFITVPEATILLAMTLTPGPAPVWAGIPVDGDDLATLPGDRGAHMRIDTGLGWGLIWFPARDFSRYSSALAGADVAIPPVVCRYRPPSQAGRQLRQLFSAAMRTTHARAGPVTEPEVAHGLEQQLIHLVVECLSATPEAMKICAPQRDQEVMARFEELVQARPEGQLGISMVSKDPDVSDRRLHQCCKEYLGISPAGYLRLHRLQLVNRALRRAAAPQTMRIRPIAQRYGFRSPGRFAVAYREIFEELPSETLRRSANFGMPEIRLGSATDNGRRRQIG